MEHEIIGTFISFPVSVKRYFTIQSSLNNSPSTTICFLIAPDFKPYFWRWSNSINAWCSESSLVQFSTMFGTFHWKHNLLKKRVWPQIYAKYRIMSFNLFLIENTTSMNVSFRQVFLWYFREHYLSLSRVLEGLIRTFNYFIEAKMGDFYSIRYYRILNLFKWSDLNSSFPGELNFFSDLKPGNEHSGTDPTDSGSDLSGTTTWNRVSDNWLTTIGIWLSWILNFHRFRWFYWSKECLGIFCWAHRFSFICSHVHFR